MNGVLLFKCSCQDMLFKQKQDPPKFPYAATHWFVKWYIKQFILSPHSEQLDHADWNISTSFFQKCLAQVDQKSVKCQLND